MQGTSGLLNWTPVIWGEGASGYYVSAASYYSCWSGSGIVAVLVVMVLPLDFAELRILRTKFLALCMPLKALGFL